MNKYNTQEKLTITTISELSLEYLVSIEIEACFGSSRERTEHFLISSNRTLEQIEQAYSTAATLYNLDLKAQCSDVEENEFTLDFRFRLEKAIPSLYWREAQGQTGADCYPPVDFEWVERGNFVYIYLLIAKLVDTALLFQFVKLNSETIGGAGLFYW